MNKLPVGLSPEMRRRLDIQGFEQCDDATLAPVAPWLRLAFALCALIAGVGTAVASPILLLLLAPVAALAAALPVHPFDLIYNLGVRRLTVRRSAAGTLVPRGKHSDKVTPQHTKRSIVSANVTPRWRSSWEEYDR